jgi:hypothetical protein
VLLIFIIAHATLKGLQSAVGIHSALSGQVGLALGITDAVHTMATGACTRSNLSAKLDHVPGGE